jgi:hypothetical protein
MDDGNYWNCCATVIDSEKYEINGLNIWQHEWHATGEHFFKKETVYQTVNKIKVYEIRKENQTIKFGAVEVSNNVWLIYTNY